MNWKFYVWAAAAMTTAITFAATVGRLDGAITGVILLASWASVFNMGYHSVNDGHDGPAQETDGEEDPVHGHQTYRPELDVADDAEAERGQVLELVRARTGTPRVIADLTGLTDTVVTRHLMDLAALGLIARNDPTRPWYAPNDMQRANYHVTGSTSDV